MTIATTAAPQIRHNARNLSIAIGVVLYLTSFFLPAVDGPNWIRGAECAWMALVIPFNDGPAILRLLLFGSGLINPLALMYLVLPLYRGKETLRRVVASIIPGLIVAAWLALAMLHMSIGIGHVLWVAGLLLMVCPGLQGARH